MATATAQRTCQYCTFLIDGTLFGVNVREVQEVIRYQPMTSVPLAHNVVSGLINLRGQIVTAVDMRRRLGLADRAEGELPVNVVIRRDDGPVSLLVDEIDDVVEIDGQTLEAPPHTVRAAGRELIAGVYQLEDRLLLVLDTEKAVSPDLF
ncbi:MAG TPA: chemotaxis protein CheW [Acidimicrobiales bacterium]|jgi:purine-binding chemotaxis protein CheW|nr:chemotaxis protein CheW [Acidimicrobiales bacterium]